MTRQGAGQTGGPGAADIPALLEAGMQAHRAGDLVTAQARYSAVLAIDPDQPDALNLAGVAAHQQGRDAEGRAQLERAVALRPHDPAIRDNLGLLLLNIGDGPAAEAALLPVLDLPTLTDGAARAHFLGRLAQARFIAGRTLDAAATHRDALRANPNHLDSLLALAEIDARLGRTDAAARLAEHALARYPGDARALHTLALVRQFQGRRAEAADLWTATSQQDPDAAGAVWNRALINLGLGRLDSGWADYEARFAGGTVKPVRTFSQPRWRGEPLAGRRLLIWREQGLGDEIMFAGLYPAVIAAVLAEGGQVVIEAEPRLLGLLRRSLPGIGQHGAGEAAVRLRASTHDDLGGPPDDFDVHIPAGSLPGLLAARAEQEGRGALTALATALPGAAWLRPDPALVAHWRRWLAGLPAPPGTTGKTAPLTIGLCWTSGLLGLQRLGNYTDLLAWRALFTLPGVRVVELQYTDVAWERAELAQSLGVAVDAVPLHIPPGLDRKDDQEGLAALLAGLDLVISAPTAVGELAAAVGTPVWRISGEGDWSRLGTGVRPWHPAMRLLTGPGGGPDGACDRVVALLKSLQPQADAPRAAAPTAPQPAPPSGAPSGAPSAIPSLADAFALHEAGRWEEAAAAYQARLAGAPGDAESWHLYGLLLFQRGAGEEAARHIAHALDIAPSAAAANNLAGVLRALGRLDEAQTRYSQALSLDPGLVDARANRGVTRQELGLLDAAQADLSAALDAAPDRIETRVNLASLLAQRGRAGAALDMARTALEQARIQPCPADVLALAHTNAGQALAALGRGGEAAAAFAQALAIDPTQALARFNLALLHLDQGDLVAGWQGYEARFAAPAARAVRPPPQPRWQGQDLRGHTLLVWREQGLGDELLFASLYPLLLTRAGRVIIECDPRLVALLARSLPQATVRPAGATPPGDADYAVPAGSLPGLLCPDLAHLTAAVAPQGYLRPDPAAQALWRDRLAACGPGLKVGICWRSGRLSEDRAALYSKLEDWRALLALPGVRLVTLQYDAAVAEPEIRAVERDLGITIHRWPDLNLRDDLDAVAALTANLDLVISAATAVAELAGALGVACWRLGTPQDWTRLGTGARPWFASHRTIHPDGKGMAAVLDQVAARVLALAATPETARDQAADTPAPDEDPDAAVALGLAAERDGDWATAQRHYLRAGGHAVALYRRGRHAREQGDRDAAVALLTAATQAQADFLAARVALAFTVLESGDAAAAAECFRDALRHAPDPNAPALAEVLSGLGAAMSAQGDTQGALACQQRATQLNPDWAGGWINLGVALFTAHRTQEAAQAYARALSLKPDDAQALTNLGNLYRLTGQLDAALDCQRRALALSPDQPDATLNLALTLGDLGRDEEAQAPLRRALELRPGWPLAAWNLALERLRQGDLAEGWGYYEARFAAGAVAVRSARPGTPWQGEALAGRHLLIWAEQGLGDEILFATLLPALVLRVLREGGRLTVAVDARLVGLLARRLHHPSLTPTGMDAARIRVLPIGPDHGADCHAPIGSLPRLLAPDIATLIDLIGPQPLLLPDPAAAAQWQARLAPLLEGGRRLLVGLSWRSGMATSLDRQGLYLTLADFAPLLRRADVSVVSLQYDMPEAEIAAVEAELGVRLHRWDGLDQKNDLDGVAALMSGLDLVISAATAVGELAGALGVPCWRFQTRGNWSSLGLAERPWFPSQRLFTAGHLPDTVPAMMAALRRLALQPPLQLAAPETPQEPAAVPPPSLPPPSLPAPSLPAVVTAHQAGRLDEAEAGYRAILAHHPQEVDALHLLGVLLSQTGRAAQGLPLVDQAVALVPDAAALRNSQGALRRLAGDMAGAHEAFAQAVALAPDDAQAWGNLGSILVDQERGADALAALDRTLTLLGTDPARPSITPQTAKTLVERAQALRQIGDAPQALALLRAVVAAQPSPYAWTNLGLALADLQEMRQAADAHRQALALDLNYAEAANNLGMALVAGGDTAGATAAFAHAARTRPDFALAQYNLGLMRLAAGAYGDGWALHEHRFAAGQARPWRHFPQPQWRGEDLRGKRLLVWREQGLGDEVMFAGLLPTLAAHMARVGATLIVECDPRLCRLLERALTPAMRGDGASVVVRGESDAPSDADLHCPMGSLPALLRPDLRSWGANRPFLTPDPALAAHWRARVDALGGGLKIGLCWRSGLGGSGRDESYTRLIDWAPLLALPGVQIITLQYDMPEAEIAAVERILGTRIARWDDIDLKQDLDAVAALTTACDLVISAPTAVGEMAGALGVPVWRVGTALDWSQLGTGARPWFPSMQIFSVPLQAKASEAIGDVVRRLRDCMRQAPPPTPGGRAGDRDQSGANTDTLLRQAIAHQQAGRLDEAAALHEAVLKLTPERPESLHLLGLIWAARGRGEEAAHLMAHAVAVDPGYTAAHVNLGNQLQALGRPDAAEAHYREALIQRPDAPDVLSNLGNALAAQGREEEALACHRRALTLAPDLAAAWRNLGALLLDRDQPGDALDAYTRALAISDKEGGAGDPDALTGLGEALRRLGRLGEAVDAHSRALARALAPHPQDPPMHPATRARVLNNRARAYESLGQDAARAADLRAALTLDPTLPAARLNLALSDLKAGRLAAGWAGYAYRFDAETKHPRPRFDAPDWQGAPLTGQTLRIWREQGLGDELMFAALYPALARRLRGEGAAGLVIECDPRLLGLFQRGAPANWQADGFVRFIPSPPAPRGRGQAEHRAAEADFVVAAGALPGLLAGDGLFVGESWLRADPERVAACRDRLAGLMDGQTRLVVGLAWRSGQGGSERSPLYSTLAQWRGLLALPGLLPVSLHYEPAQAEIAAFNADRGDAAPLQHLADLDLRNDLEMAAALTTACDLVISPATAVGELAGALGVPCWRFAPRDWTSLGGGVRPFFPSQRPFDIGGIGVAGALAAMGRALEALR